MEKFTRGPAWQILIFLVPLYYGIISSLLAVASIQGFFFKDQLHIYLFILLYILPLIIFIITLLAFRKVRASLLTKFRIIWYFFLGAFKSTTERRKLNQPWVYDFYEKYNEVIAYRMPERLQCEPEMSGGIVKKALRAQPPPNDSGWYLYKVLLPEKIRRLELSFFIGIRDEVEIPIGASVRFKVKVDDAVVFSEDYDTRQWQYHVVTLKYEPGVEIGIFFETEARGIWMGNGAMWGEPILKGIL